MDEQILMEIGLIIIFGISAQWLAWRLKMPSILLLLLFGLLAGPVLNILHPDEVLGDLLFPAVSLSVGIILFEGGMGLRLKNLRQVRTVVQNLISVGALITIVVGTPAVHFLFGLSWQLSILLASILVVSGPTVVTPLLRFIRPNEKVASVLRWEGILIDPIGATLAVLAFEAIKSGGAYRTHILSMIGGVAMTLLVGGALGAIAAILLVRLISRGWIPEYLQTSMALVMMMGMFILSNNLVAESELMGATVMGVVLANQKKVNIEHIVEFKEQLGVLLLSFLFIVLSARVRIDELRMLGWQGFVFLAILIFIARPLAVWASTRGSNFTRKENMFMSWMAPRGIVAMSVASLFGLDLVNTGVEGAELIVPVTILVVIGTVVVYAFTAGPLARKLDLVEKNPQGVLIVGAHYAARMIAKAVQDAGFYVALVDTRGSNIQIAKQFGLQALEKSIFSDAVQDQLPLGEIGYLLALTPDDEVNALAGMRFEQLLGKEHIYQLHPIKDDFSETVRQKFHGRYLFQCAVTYESLETAVNFGGSVHLLDLVDANAVNAYQSRHSDEEILLFTIKPNRQLQVANCDSVVNLKPGDQVISLQIPKQELPQMLLDRMLPSD